MKCIVHNDTDAVGQCTTCWWGLCKDCIHNFTISICPSCNLKYWENRKKEILWLKKKIPLYSLGIWFLLIIMGGSSLGHVWNTEFIMIYIMYSVFWVFIYFWWLWINDLNKDTVTITTNYNPMAMILGKVFKLVIAWMVWVFVCPYKIYQLRKEYKISIKTIELCKSLLPKS